MGEIIGSIIGLVALNTLNAISFLSGFGVASIVWGYIIYKFYIRKSSVTKDVRYHCNLLKQEGGNEWEDIVITNNKLKFNPCRYFKKGKCIKINSKCLATTKFS
ncbi:hypothetical protein CFT13S00388_02430 [Campylobacter fetus subsp. testudinum]|uniref:hypothetical protein n=1 Tax=Campylobacter fetus TaxID=196 RepID=UPI000818781F|nr:hypothetical protein [Campylobacter fetus]OCR88045.1 hypothetical protein CFT13S00388_02430 [Campylobacter fetus subsp. testudinum]